MAREQLPRTRRGQPRCPPTEPSDSGRRYQSVTTGLKPSLKPWLTEPIPVADTSPLYACQARTNKSEEIPSHSLLWFRPDDVTSSSSCCCQCLQTESSTNPRCQIRNQQHTHTHTKEKTWTVTQYQRKAMCLIIHSTCSATHLK